LENKSKYHWVTIVICCGLAASAVGICNNSVGVFFVPVSVDLGVGRGAFALHATISNILAGLFCPISIKLIRKYNYKLMICIGILMAGGANMLMAFGNNVFMYYALGAMRGIGCSLFALPTITSIIGNWFEEKHGFAMGFTLSFSGLSGAIFAPLFSSLIVSIGWRQTFFIMGIMTIVLALPGTLFLLKLNPSEKNLLPYGAKEPKKIAAVQEDNKVKKAKLNMAPLFIMIFFSFMTSSICGIAQNFPGYAQSIGSTATIGATMVSASMIGNIVFKLLMGIMSDKFGPLNSSKILGATNILSLILLLILNPTQSYIATLFTAFIYGAIYANGAVGIPLITRYIFGNENYASAYSVLFMFTSIGSATALTIIGVIYDIFKTYSIAIYGGIAFGIINILLLFIMNRFKKAEVKETEELQAGF